MATTSNLKRWTTENSSDLYGISRWGRGYFTVNEAGEACAILRENGKEHEVSLNSVVEGLAERGFDMPVIVRFEDFLERQIDSLNEAFGKAIKDLHYRGNYRGVYPIKVNQQEQVVRAITERGKKHHFGLEAGSKGELVAALAYMHDYESFIVCNGYKDAEFIDLALYATKLGIRTVLVVEMPEELSLIIARSKALGIDPYIGVRIKLSAESSGHWNDSGGDRSVFGLNITQLVDLVDELKEADMLHALKLLHYHQGSQIPNIRSIRDAAAEAIRVYVNLVKEGAPMGLLDVGGGLAVDYDGSQTNFQSSCNYSVNEYTADVVETIMTTLDAEGIEHPTIISESGRATVAYCSVLLFNVFAVTKFIPKTFPDELSQDAPEMLRNLLYTYRNLTQKNVQEAYNDALYYRGELVQHFKRGEVTMRERARGEHIFWNIVARVAKEVDNMGKFTPPDLEGVSANLTDIYHVNFSLFQSLPDSWAIDQLFPVMPIQRLAEKPTNEAILADITCDCDGKIDKFIDHFGVRKSLPLHEVNEGEDYVLGVFLVGAYQETLGDLHNLLGDTNIVSVRVEEGELDFQGEVQGDTVADVLSYVEYEPKEMAERFRHLAERSVKRKVITPAQRKEITKAYADALHGYTYFHEKTVRSVRKAD